MLIVDLAESARTIEPASPAFRAFLEAQLPQQAEPLLAQIQANVPRYLTMAPAPPLERVRTNLAAYTAALADPSQLITWTQQQIGPTFADSLELREVLLLLSLFRATLLDTGLRAVEAGVAGAPRGVQTLMALVDLRTRLFGQLYHDLQQLFVSLVDNALDAIVVSDQVGKTIYRNKSSRSLGASPPAWYIADPQALAALAPDERERLQSEVMPQLEAGGSWQGASWCTSPDGQRRRMENSVILLRHSSGEPMGVGAFARDVTADYDADMALKEQAEKLRKAADRLEQSFLSTPLAALEWDATGTITRWNPSAERIFGWTAEEAIGKNAILLVAPYIAPADVPKIVAMHMQGEIVNSRFVNITKDGREITCQWYNALLRNQAGEVVAVLAQAEDLSGVLRAEQERAALQEQVIEGQQAALRELSTPLIPLADGVVAMPLIGGINSERAQQVVEELLHGVSAHRATTAIIDITGVPVVDTQVAGAFLRAAQAVELLGARVVLTGIRPEVAQTLVGIGANLGNIATRSTLQDGIAFALRVRS